MATEDERSVEALTRIVLAHEAVIELILSALDEKARDRLRLLTSRLAADMHPLADEQTPEVIASALNLLDAGLQDPEDG